MSKFRPPFISDHIRETLLELCLLDALKTDRLSNLEPIVEIKGSEVGWDRVERGHRGIVLNDNVLSIAGNP